MAWSGPQTSPSPDGGGYDHGGSGTPEWPYPSPGGGEWPYPSPGAGGDDGNGGGGWAQSNPNFNTDL